MLMYITLKMVGGNPRDSQGNSKGKTMAWLFILGGSYIWKANGAKFKNQNCLHIQQIFYQGQERFQSSSPKSSHVQRIFFQGHGIF